MNQKKNNSSTEVSERASVIRVGTAVYLFISIFLFLAVYDFYQGFILIGNPPSLESKRFVVFWIFSLFPCALWIMGLLRALDGRLPGQLHRTVIRVCDSLPHTIRVVLVIILIFFTTVLFLYTSFGNYQFIYWLRLFTIFFCGFTSAFLLFYRTIDFQFLIKASGMVLLASVVFVLGDWMTGVSDYPFSLSWSEGNRFWDYSIMFGVDRYINPTGETVIPFLEAGRQFLWALPFAIPSVGIWGMRLWNVILWVVPPLVLGWAAVFNRKTFRREWVWQIGFGSWCFMFLSQGPIYPPLVICAILVVIGLRQKNLFVAILLVALASYYARISRWTWMYAPGLWAGLVTLIEIKNPSFGNKRWKELIRPVLMGLSGLVGVEVIARLVSRFSQNQVVVEGNVVLAVTDSFALKQPFIWERLFPNPTYAPGILLGYLWVGGPLLLFFVWMIVRRYWKTNWMQNMSLAVIIGTFSVIGVIISVKIGGGSNLHNLDMLWMTMVMAAAWIFRDWLDRGLPGLSNNKALIVIFCLTLVFPTTTMIQYGEPFIIPGDYFVTSSLEKLKIEVADAQEKGEVLFMDQRQLLTFGYVTDVPLVAEYEKKLMMDKAMSEDKVFLDGFYEDIQNHRFSMIVTEPLRKSMADESTRNFAEENNFWVYWVSRPILQYYKPKVTYDEVGVQLLIPREK
ncbi:MAG: hypothetical protein GX577_11820 [Leptolinea sp.]|nr:hypothetical protein [Leptolinea sp.]